MFFQDIKTRYKKLLIILLPIFIIFLILVILIIAIISRSNGFSSKSKERHIESMNYTLRHNATDYQVQLFDELEEAIERGEDLEIAEAVAKNYCADIYTWTNKESKWDIGGMCYVYSKQNNAIYYQTKDTLYQLFERSLDNYGKDGLIEITDVQIIYSNKMSELYEVEGKQYEAYEIGCKMQMNGIKDLVDKITRNNYFTIIKNKDKNDRFEIVALYGD